LPKRPKLLSPQVYTFWPPVRAMAWLALTAMATA